MIDELQARFLPRFTALARSRLDRACAAAAARDFDGALETARDLHAIAGEAGLLGLAAIVPLARDGEDCARRATTSHADRDADELAAALAALSAAIDALRPATAGEPVQPTRSTDA